MAKAIMIQGTASGVGKTILTLALCRIFAQDGHKVAPFKAQNMTTHTTITKNGDEIAVSGWLQAKAAGIEPCADVAPIVVKPPFEMPAKESRAIKIEKIMQAYGTLNEQYDIIVIEGAGSPVELNLNSDDFANMGLASRVDAPVILVGDIDRGGVFASLYGTLAIMSDDDRKRVKATIVNRFYGVSSDFADGVAILEELTGIPVAGVVPYAKINLPEEDGLRNGAAFNKNANYETQFDTIAAHVRKSFDMEFIYKILEDGHESCSFV